ncbi:hypothetical protein Poli38472_004009 [Pythium oligandrum]|uniref:VPS37 C-terminal domain-containing protein n=1 Tax=Pythium oligandrum TaxID=41045 RepID=A0A8K1CNA8_PYTOL|nr:hypothetical protein Poli38472_004009 [Pythium oligandrum]|eukprot:TMW66244.1 hypothetical protein Poli38472_004009 [Pythium oligandrum]
MERNEKVRQIIIDAMSFLGYRFSQPAPRPSQETQQSELERLRGRQLASLVRAGGRAKNHQQTTFEVAVTDTQRGPLVLTITLSSDFPLKAPHVQASLPVQHPWLDAVGNVQGHTDLNQWTAHSDIGRIVSEIVNELRRAASAGQLKAAAAGNLPPQAANAQVAYPAPYQYPASVQPPAQPQPQQNSEPQRSQMPVIPAIFPELEELSISQLENLLNDRQALKTFVKKIEVVKEFVRLREEVMNGNMGIAEKTLSYEEQLRELQGEVQELRESLRVTQESLAEKQMRQQRVVARHRPDALLEQLTAATHAIDSSSDDLAHQFTHGEVDFSTFISEYLPQRTLYHQRTIKLNRVYQH